MKSLFSSLLIAFSFLSSLPAQVLEQYFDGKEVNRFATPTAGAKYIYFDNDSKEITLLNPDYTTYKSFQVTGLPDTISYLGTYFHSETQFNNDAQIEFVLYYYTQTSGSHFRIVNENGQILFGDVEPPIGFFEVNGARKILVENEVYSVPGYTLEHAFLNGVDIFALDNGEIKFAENLFDGSDLYNADYTLWKTIPFQDDPLCPYQNRYTYSDKLFNDNSDIEFITVSFCNDNSNFYSTLDVRNESNAVLFADTTDSYLSGIVFQSSVTGLSDNRFGVQVYDTLDIYKLPDFVHEKTFTGTFYSTLDQSGFKYFENEFDSDAAGNVQLYNPDYSNWKTVSKQAGYYLGELYFSEKLIDTDPGLEAIGTYATFSEEGVRIINEDGTVVFTATEPDYCYVDRWPGHPNKLICTRYDGDTDLTDTWIYGLPTSTLPVHNAPELNFAVTASPNPFSGSFTIQTEGISNTWDAKVQVFNILGESMPFFRQDADLTIGIHNTANWPAGIYMAVIRVGNERANLKLVKK